MASHVQRIHPATLSRVHLGRDPRFVVRRRKPRKAHGRIASLTLLLAAALAPFASTTVAFQDMASLFGKDLPQAQRWLAYVVPTPSGEAYLPSMPNAGAKGLSLATSHGTLIEETLQLASSGPVSAPIFIPPAVNRGGKADIVVPQRKAQVATVRFKAGTLASGGKDAIFALAEANRASAFAAPQDVPKNELALAPRLDPKPAVATPTVVLASIAPAESSGKGRRSKTKTEPDLAVSAYANPDDTAAIDAPFKAILNKPMSMGIDGKRDHWWVTNPLPPVTRSKTEQKCLATAIYFEARGEPEKGELAVAQVVVNRVKNPAYPNTICGVVYQNKNMRNACQFSFACDGIKDRITDMTSWKRAQELARRVVYEDNWWNAKVGSSTHYHANYVKPRWARTMRKMQKIGHHVFYKTYGGGWI